MDLFTSLNNTSQIKRLSPGRFIGILAKRLNIGKRQRDSLVSSAFLRHGGDDMLDVLEAFVTTASHRYQSPDFFSITFKAMIDWLRSSQSAEMRPSKRIEIHQHYNAVGGTSTQLFKCSASCAGHPCRHDKCPRQKPSPNNVKIVPRFKTLTISERPGDSATAVTTSSSGSAEPMRRRRQRLRFNSAPLRKATDTPISCPYGDQQCTVCIGLWSRLRRCTKRACKTSQEHVDGSHPSYNAAELRYVRSRHPKYWQDKYLAGGMEPSSRPSSPASTLVAADGNLDSDAEHTDQESLTSQRSTSSLSGKRRATTWMEEVLAEEDPDLQVPLAKKSFA